MRRILGLIALLPSLGLGLGLWVYFSLPSADQIRAMMKHPQVSVTLTEDGRLTDARCRGCGIFLEADAIPATVKDAVIAVEDRRFRSHWGVDPVGLARAALVNLTSGRLRQGGSTITQQLAKQLMLSPRRTLPRKLHEAALALKIELHFSKDEILAAYLNHAYFGRTRGNVAYSLEQAARKYFGKRARDLNLTEAAMLAGALKAPNVYNPQRNPAKARARARVVLATMVEAGVISRAEAERAGQARVRPGSKPFVPLDERYFVSWVTEQAADLIPEGSEAQTLFLITTFEPNRQLYAELAGRRLLGWTQGRRARQLGLVAMELDGAVRAMVGGRSFAESQFNRVTQARRQPASAFKPLVYLAALEAGYRPASLIEDRPTEIDGWRPRNFDGRYHGRVTLTEALSGSYNAATVRLAQRVGFARIADLARRLGLPVSREAHPSLALGASEASLLELTSIYASFAKEGAKVRPFGIYGIRDTRGRMLYWRGRAEEEQVVDARAARDLNLMLRQVVTKGTGRQAAFSHAACGKTGTSQEHRDAWFIGFSGQLATGLWIGNDDGSPMRAVTGGQAPARAWRNFMENAHLDRAPQAIAGLQDRKPWLRLPWNGMELAARFGADPEVSLRLVAGPVRP